MHYKPFIIIVSAPSGAGKTSIVKTILERNAYLKYSISATTRFRRENEIDGHDYFFMPVSEFEAKVDQDAFAEWALVHDNYYGTPHSYLQAQMAQGYCILMDIDIQGARQIRAKYPDSISIFIAPPSPEILEKRLRGRGTDSEESIQIRLEKAKVELTALPEYQYVIINHDLKEATDHTEAIIIAEQHRQSRFNKPLF